MNRLNKFILCLLLFTVADPPDTFAQGYILWDESVNGPLGNAPGSATALGSLSIGTNSLLGRSEAFPIGQSWGVNGDFFTFGVPTGAEISSMQYVTDRGTWVWMGDSTFGNQIGFARNAVNGNLLPQFGLGPVPNGYYSMYALNNDLQAVPTIATYRLDIVVMAVPEPGTWGLLALGVAAFGYVARRRRK